MSIHSLSDSNPPRRLPIPLANADPLTASLLGEQPSIGTPDSIRKESCWDMIRLSTCPYFELQSFISLMCVVDVCMYAMSVAVEWEPGQFATPSFTALQDMGAKDAYKLQADREIWRWFLPIVLHAAPAHLVFNLLFQALIGYRIEPTMGWKQTAILYWTSGLGGVLLSAVCSPTTLGVGASACILGMVTGSVTLTQLAYLAVNWTRLSGSYLLQYTLCWLLVMLVINLLFTAVPLTQGLPGTDAWGHLGGCLTGFAVGYVLFLPSDADINKTTISRVLLAALGVYFVGGLAVFYMGTEVTPLT